MPRPQRNPVARKDLARKRCQTKLAMKRPAKKLCLVTMVRNESRIIHRMLNSAKPAVDMVYILDTHSSDNTVELSEQWIRESGLPGKVEVEPFVNFGVSRTRSLKGAQQAFPEADYFLLLDADMLLEVDEGFDKRLLFEDKYLMIQYNPTLSYHNLRILKNGPNYLCKGSTHEYWCTLDGSDRTIGTLNTIRIDDQNDGGCTNTHG